MSPAETARRLVQTHKKAIIIACVLALALFFERFCFIVTVYKTQGFGYISILGVIFLKAVFDGVQVLIKKRNHKKKLDEHFQLERSH